MLVFLLDLKSVSLGSYVGLNKLMLKGCQLSLPCSSVLVQL